MVVGKMMRLVLEVFLRTPPGVDSLTAEEVDRAFKRPAGQSPDVAMRLHTLERAKLIERDPSTSGAIRWRITQSGRQSLQATTIED